MTAFTIEDLILAWDGESVVIRFDLETRSWIIIALHSSRLGQPTGGCRMQVYASPADGLRDAMRLAEGMTCKWAALGMRCGGGKAVLAVPETLEGEARRGLLERFAHLLNQLRGSFSTGRDLGTTDDDMRVMASITRWVHGVDRGSGTVRDPGPYTARGVLAAIRATCKQLFGTAELQGRTVLIQGVGAVGAPLARLLAETGAKLLLSDLDGPRVASLASALGAQVVAPEAVIGTECDIYAPCAVGATLHAETISRLNCRGVAGSANNQLREHEDAERLHARGILYAPDYVANGGGAKAFLSIHSGVTDDEELGRLVDAIGDSLDGVFTEAAARGESPARTARHRVDAVLAAAISSGRRQPRQGR